MYSFSKRTDWEHGENPLSLALTELRAQGTDIVDLTESNPTKCGLNYPADIFLKPLSAAEGLTYAPQPLGLLSAREAVARYYNEKCVHVSPEQIMLTASTSEGYSYIFRLLAGPGEKVLLPAPSYPLFSYLAGLCDVEVGYYAMTFEGGRWQIDVDALKAAIDDKTRAIILVSPNNPTGSFVKRDELKKLNHICAAHGLALICDEVFGDYIFPGFEKEYVSLASNAEVPTFVLSGLSKAVALPQMKLGWVVVNGPEAYKKEAMPRLEVIADTYLSVNTPVQHAAPLWLKERAVMRDQVMARVTENFRILNEEAAHVKIAAVLPVEGGWYAALKMDMSEEEDIFAVQLLKEQHVYVHPGFFFDFPEEGYIVLSLLPVPTRFREGIRRLLNCQQPT
ncbi:MAG: pyridoxal phosphate-dependent aminotransferase [Candidatus Omnitrophica bacterium]|nr:pyridoxal phosphate-dependent aminotransferase [Candidatus Omnitrophota bacterium]